MIDRYPVLFVGAGPGSADLLTVRAARAIERADVILHDSLVAPEVLALASGACRLFDVGKRGDGEAFPQTSTNAMMAHFARAGLRVVRLKGGDPSLFGRLEEERDYLEVRGFETETVPGVTAASAAAAQFKFSLTERDVARRVVFTTARASGGAVTLPDADALADEQATLVFYMAAHVAAEVQHALVAAGRAADTPVLLVEHAGSLRGRARSGVLRDLAVLVGVAKPSGPSLIVVGPVARRVSHNEMICDVQHA